MQSLNALNCIEHMDRLILNAKRLIEQLDNK